MKFYDLFAGIGGFRLGLERAGFLCVGSCEIDRYAREVYRKNFGDYPTESDVREVAPTQLSDFDILTAGFPCQAFSSFGKRMGFNESRGTLFFEIARIAATKRPKIIFLENVKGLLNHNGGSTFGTIINTLYELGYSVEWQIINGKYFVPQNRERVFIIGHLGKETGPKTFPILEGCQINDTTPQETQREGERFRDARSHSITSTYWKGWGGSRTMILTENRPRKLTPLECERLMGFPDGWTEGQSDTQRYKMLGNAVIPQIIEMIGHIIKHSS